jgi:hypothetical protein
MPFLIFGVSIAEPSATRLAMHRCRGIARLVIRRYGLAHAFRFIYFFYRHVSAANTLSLTPFFVFSPSGQCISGIKQVNLVVVLAFALP